MPPEISDVDMEAPPAPESPRDKATELRRSTSPPVSPTPVAPLNAAPKDDSPKKAALVEHELQQINDLFGSVSADAASLAIQRNFRKLVTDQRLQWLFLRELLDGAPAVLLKKTLGQYGERLLEAASDDFLDRALEARLITIGPKDLVQMLARAKRLGYDEVDEVDPDETVVPVEEEVNPTPQVPMHYGPPAGATYPPLPPHVQQYPVGQPPPPPPIQSYPPVTGGFSAINAQPTPTPALNASPQMNSGPTTRKNSPATSKFVCPDCHGSFTQAAGLKYHVDRKVCHKTQAIPATSLKYYCDNCGKGFTNSGGHRYHTENKVCRSHNMAQATSPSAHGPNQPAAYQPAPPMGSPALHHPSYSQQANNLPSVSVQPNLTLPPVQTNGPHQPPAVASAYPDFRLPPPGPLPMGIPPTGPPPPGAPLSAYRTAPPGPGQAPAPVAGSSYPPPPQNGRPVSDPTSGPFYAPAPVMMPGYQPAPPYSGHMPVPGHNSTPPGPIGGYQPFHPPASAPKATPPTAPVVVPMSGLQPPPVTADALLNPEQLAEMNKKLDVEQKRMEAEMDRMPENMTDLDRTELINKIKRGHATRKSMIRKSYGIRIRTSKFAAANAVTIVPTTSNAADPPPSSRSSPQASSGFAPINRIESFRATAASNISSSPTFAVQPQIARKHPTPEPDPKRRRMNLPLEVIAYKSSPKPASNTAEEGRPVSEPAPDSRKKVPVLAAQKIWEERHGKARSAPVDGETVEISSDSEVATNGNVTARRESIVQNETKAPPAAQHRSLPASPVTSPLKTIGKGMARRTGSASFPSSVAA